DHEGQHHIGNAEQHQHQQEADEQLHARTCPFESLVHEARARPEILSFARRRPEAIDAERYNTQQQVGEGNRREFLPTAVETESGFGAVLVIMHSIPPPGPVPKNWSRGRAAMSSCGVRAARDHSRRKSSSIGRPNTSEMRKASGSEGSYLPVSIALTLWRETPSRTARSCWLQSRSARSTLRRFFKRRSRPCPW